MIDEEGIVYIDEDILDVLVDIFGTEILDLLVPESQDPIH